MVLAPWLLLLVALDLMGVPGVLAQPNMAQQEASMVADRPGVLNDLLHQAERLLLQADPQELQAEMDGQWSDPQADQPHWLTKRQHPGRREEKEVEEVEEEEEETAAAGGAVGPHKRQHPGRREQGDHTPQKRQHPGRRLANPESLGWGVAEEEGREEGEQEPEKRQHPGRRALGALDAPCGSRSACILLRLLREWPPQKRQHPGRRAAWAGQPLWG
ncbi:thyrotropin releasing hormone [Erinaceus europaeus]|uniref:Pro-thyrotropin-releasing hormone n=1 Tax=Erinaceus europaeus TaxID=9365 RepID=A0A1S2ZCD1_ERIEU|nr:thyrotropin releasing hormone [Erinaceus europaeus]